MSREISVKDRLNFFGVDETTKEFIRSLRPLMEKKLPEALDSFYAHVKQWPELASLFSSEAHIRHAKQKQYEHWMNNIISGELSDNYVHSVKAIGKTHHRLNLEPFWYIGGYAKLADELIVMLYDNYKGGMLMTSQDGIRKRAIQTIMKAMMFDISYSISVYLEEGDKERENILVSISSSVEETSSNVSTIAASIEEITRSIDGFSERIRTVSQMAAESSARVEDTTVTVRNLEQSAQEINNVVAMIEGIAEQTNMLALNATIEAARSGEAGKGFAVVANEVKALASETAQAIGGISEKVEMIKRVTQQTVSAISEISQSIKNVDQQTAEMRNDIEEQLAALQEIAKNTDEAAQGAGEVAQSIQAMQKGGKPASNDQRSQPKLRAAAE